MKKILIIAIVFMSCSKNEFPHVYEQRGVIKKTDKGFYFFPVSSWQDYTPHNDGDTVTRYSLIKPK